MGTSWMEIITNFAMLYIDDTRLTELVQTSPALFFRRMALYMGAAIPAFNRPPEIAEYLRNGAHDASYDDFEWVSTQESINTSVNVETGKTGYDLCSVVIRETGDMGDVNLIPYTGAAYDKETGVVTFPKQNTTGTVYEVDFYTDGYFLNELTGAQKRVLGLCVACVWDERFSRNWLNMQMKIHDQSFDTVNESNYIKEVSTRLATNRAELAESLRKYEQDCAYLNTVTAKGYGMRPIQFA